MIAGMIDDMTIDATIAGPIIATSGGTSDPAIGVIPTAAGTAMCAPATANTGTMIRERIVICPAPVTGSGVAHNAAGEHGQPGHYGPADRLLHPSNRAKRPRNKAQLACRLHLSRAFPLSRAVRPV
ncbi:hypothetical protein NT2_01_06310 [Caenibius tardaugens NBRC 16725]|uniref:Uncharacterized protein n=1 Tax=Caenibius tardaugens NBRC 16725 TaxID=1219035 RepID=U2YIF6_9SPHN|nr:hypothetical protein NT2_01_06310 [Caenibius tardaugens NBRC 16725]